MSFRSPKRRHTEFDFHAHGDIPDFEQRVADIKRVYDGMSEISRLIIPAEHCSSIHIHEGTVPESGGGRAAHAKYAKGERKIELPTQPDLTEVPDFLRPLYSDFNFTAAHELHHPVIIKLSARTGHNDEGYRSAREAALARIRTTYPEVQARIEPILAALRECDEAEVPDKPNLRASIIAMAGIGNERPPEEQVAFYMGLMLSDEFHKAFGYTMDVARMKPDTTYDEDLCNTRALAYKFGPASVKTVAGELVNHIEKREALYRQLLDTKGGYADWCDTFGHIEKAEWRDMIAALEDQFPSGGPGSSMGSAMGSRGGGGSRST